MSALVRRVFCPQCGAMRIRLHRSRYAVCPNGHGRLVSRFTETERHKAIASKLPRARRVGRNAFVIDGHEGRFAYRAGSGRRPATPDQKVEADEVLARHVTRARTLIRVFALRSLPRTKG